MAKAEKIDYIANKNELYKNLTKYCCLFTIEFENLQSGFLWDNYISLSRCDYIEKPYHVDNGRVSDAKRLRITITEQDYFIINKVYTWDRANTKISNFRRYKKSYLPTDFVKAILKLYEDKTTLKNVDGKEAEYMLSKQMLNACYGMAVTSIVRPEYVYTDDWQVPQEPDFETEIAKYNKNANRFLYFPWGVWITAYCRRNLWTGIIEFDKDYVYADTDSIKCRNYENHSQYIENYNRKCRLKLEKAMEFHKIPIEKTEPMTIKGIKKPLGVWDFEGTYDRFKTLGAKRYMTETEGKISITVSGLNKKVTVPYLLETYEEKVFNAFDKDLYVPAQYTGKNTHTYIDAEQQGVLEDYQGNVAEYHELSSVHLEESDYSLSISQEYVDFILDRKELC